MSKYRILFVDDEPNVLRALQRMTYRMREEWDMAFAANAHEGLEIMSGLQFDVVVSDMRMPGMDGVEFLEEVTRRQPGVVRILLSGHSDQQSIMKSVGPAHQFLTKPCRPEKLKETLHSALAMRGLLKSEPLRDLVAHLKTLPSLPTVYLDLVRELQKPDTTMTQVGQIIARDIGMTAKILQTVNSSFFGLQVHVSDPVHAARLLGPEILKGLVLSVQIFSKYGRLKCQSLSLEALSEHSGRVATLAKQIISNQGGDRIVADNTFIAGMLHDVGKLILADNLPERFDEALHLAEAEKLPVFAAEEKVLGASHDVVGAYLLGIWGLPSDIIEAVAFHHVPRRQPRGSFGPLPAVYLADFADHYAQQEHETVICDELDRDYLEKVGLKLNFDAWLEDLKEIRTI